MSVLRPRNRSVYFRISEDEFHALESLCQEGHARSISELSREAVVMYLRGFRDERPEKADERLHSFECKIADLQRRLNELQGMLQLQTVRQRPAAVNGNDARHE